MLTTPAFAGKKPEPTKNDWGGWWFVYHRDDKGALVLDNFRLAMVVDDIVMKGELPVTGIWNGCIWNPVNRMRYGKDSVSLVISRRETFMMVRTGPDEAHATFSSDPKYAYVAKRTRRHGDCAGYDGDPEPE